MPATPNAHWYDQTLENGYPISDLASATDDSGAVIPAGILIDASVSYPNTAGTHVYVAALTVGPGVLTVICNISNDINAAGVPLFAATMTRPLKDRRLVQITPYMDGVGGWVVFGSVGETTVRSYRCSTPAQSLLANKAARAYQPLPVKGVKTQQAAKYLTGLVNLEASAPFNIVAAKRIIDGAQRNCIVFRLVATQGDAFSADTESVFSSFAGPCAVRPESETCPDPQPIETIAQIQPNCAGEITLEFKGCAQLAVYPDGHGFVINCATPRQAVCPTPFIPDDEGNLPNSYGSIVVIPVTTTTTTTTTTTVTDGTGTGDMTLPFLECWQDGVSDDFGVLVGSFAFEPVSDPYDFDCAGTDIGVSIASQDLGGINLAGYIGNDVTSVGRKITCHFKLNPTIDGTIGRGGVLINFRSGDGQYHAAYADYLNQTLNLIRKNGVTTQVIASEEAPGLNVTSWYRMEVTTVAVPGTNGVEISVQLVDADAVALVASIVDALATNYRPASGIAGIYADRSKVHFSFLKYEVYP